MTSNKSVCALIMGPDGELGIKGKGYFKSVDEVEKFISDAREQMLAAFWFQKGRGAISAA